MPRNARADAGSPAALTCADVRAREWDFVEGVLPIPEQAAVQAHLDGCGSCYREMTLCGSASSALLSASAQIPAPGDLRTGFYSRLAAQQQPSRRYGRPLALSALAIGALVLALVRPALQSPIASPTRTGNTPATLAFVPAAPIIASTPPARLSEETPLRLSIVPGLSEAQAEELLAAGTAGSIAPTRHRRTLHRLVQHRLVARLDRRLGIGRLLLTNPADARLYSYYIPDLAKAGKSRLAQQTANLPTRQVKPQANTLHLKLEDRQAKLAQIVVTAMPSEDGVSLEVTDQVRGFSNSTHVASDVELQGEGSTIHIEADGD